jgi:hypothetical protein
MVDTQLATYQPSQSIILNNALGGIRSSLERAAQANLDAAIAESGEDGFTEVEKHAMLVFEELRLVNGIDLSALLLRYEKLTQIENEALWTIHPNTATAANTRRPLAVIAKEVGCSVSELSNTKDLCGVIFPFMQDRLGMNIAVAWEEIGKGGFREMVAVLKGIITGEHSDSTQTNNAIDRILDDAAATARAAGQALNDNELREAAVSNILTAGGQMTNAELREHIRNGEETPTISATDLIVDGRHLVIQEMDEDQFVMWQRKMGRRVDTNRFELPADPRARRSEAARIRPVRTIANLMNGE